MSPPGPRSFPREKKKIGHKLLFPSNIAITISVQIIALRCVWGFFKSYSPKSWLKKRFFLFLHLYLAKITFDSSISWCLLTLLHCNALETKFCHLLFYSFTVSASFHTFILRPLLTLPQTLLNLFYHPSRLRAQRHAVTHFKELLTNYLKRKNISILILMLGKKKYFQSSLSLKRWSLSCRIKRCSVQASIHCRLLQTAAELCECSSSEVVELLKRLADKRTLAAGKGKCWVSHTTALSRFTWWKWSSVLEAENSSCQNFKRKKCWSHKLQPWLVSYSYSYTVTSGSWPAQAGGQISWPVEHKGAKCLAQGHHKVFFEAAAVHFV